MPDTIRAVMVQAALQDGAISTAQLRAAGMGDRVVERRLRAGWLRRLHRGVYLVGAVAGPLAAEHAALLACGPGAVVSHGSAAAVWKLRTPGESGGVDVTLIAGHRRSRGGIALHHAPLRHGEVRHVGRLRLTSPARTLLDLAAVLAERELEIAVNEAEVLGLVRPSQLRALLARGSRPRGAATLGALLADVPLPTRSELERRMLVLLERVGLPLPRTQARVLRYTVDFLWPRERVVVEMDGFGPHGTRMRFEADRARDAALVAAGYRVLRFTWRQLAEQPEVVAARLAVVLAQSSAAA
jgi:very-short-patch-repair endonuclease